MHVFVYVRMFIVYLYISIYKHNGRPWQSSFPTINNKNVNNKNIRIWRGFIARARLRERTFHISESASCLNCRSMSSDQNSNWWLVSSIGQNSIWLVSSEFQFWFLTSSMQIDDWSVQNWVWKSAQPCMVQFCQSNAWLSRSTAWTAEGSWPTNSLGFLKLWTLSDSHHEAARFEKLMDFSNNIHHSCSSKNRVTNNQQINHQINQRINHQINQQNQPAKSTSQPNQQIQVPNQHQPANPIPQPHPQPPVMPPQVAERLRRMSPLLQQEVMRRGPLDNRRGPGRVWWVDYDNSEFISLV